MPHQRPYIPGIGVPPSDTGVYDAIRYMLNALKAEIQEFGPDSIEVQDTLQKLQEYYGEYLPYLPKDLKDVIALEDYLGKSGGSSKTSGTEFNWMWIVVIILLLVVVYLLMK